MMRLAILAPIRTSPYARLLAHLLSSEPGVTLAQVIVRTPWTLQRMRSEFRRDGLRLLRKAHRKLILRERAYADERDTIVALSRQHGLSGRTIEDVARMHGFPVTTVKDHNDAAALRTLSSAQADVVAFTGGGLLRKELLSIPRLGVLNCHMGVLPQYRGMDVVEWPFLEHSRVEAAARVGLTVHYMDAGVDTGPILLRRPIPVTAGETFARIRQRMEPQMVLAMLDAIRGVRDGVLSPVVQSAADGRQYYVMHPRVYAASERRLAGYRLNSGEFERTQPDSSPRNCGPN